MDMQIIFRAFLKEMKASRHKAKIAINQSKAARELRAKTPVMLLPEMFWHLKDVEFDLDDISADYWALFVTTYVKDEHLDAQGVLKANSSFKECLAWLERYVDQLHLV